MSELVEFKAVTELADISGLSAENYLALMRDTVPSGTTDRQLIHCLSVAREHNLNPLTKEIYFMPTKGGKTQPIVSVDGWMRKANEHPQFDGVRFESEIGEDNTIISMTCHMYRKDRAYPVSVTEYLEECQAPNGPWQTHPKRMLRNRTYCQAARMAFGFAGIMEPDEFRQWQDNPNLNPEPVALEVVADDPRDGADIIFKGEARKRPSSGAFKDTGGIEKYHALIVEIEGAETKADVLSCYDSFAKDGTPWAIFPQGWARLVQEAYYYKLKSSDNADPAPEPELAPIDALEMAINAASTPDDLGQLFRLSFDDGTPWCAVPADQRDDIQAAYDARRDELMEVAG